MSEYGERPADAKKVDGAEWCTEAEEFSEEAARDFYHNRDGWESKWPLEFTVIDDDGLEHRFSVEMEFEPTFSADEIFTENK